MGKKVIVIGAGAAGMSAAVYLRKYGFAVQVLEQGERPGGLCTTWVREGFSFESCLYWVFGTNPASSFYPLWEELGIFRRLEFHHFENFMELEDSAGFSFSLWSDLNRLAEELKQNGPPDGHHIDRLLADARRLGGFQLYIDRPRSLYRLSDFLKAAKAILPYLDLFIKYRFHSMETYCRRLKDQKLKEILLDFMHHIEHYPMILVLLIFAYMDTGNADYPLGGSMALSGALYEEACSAGAHFCFNSPVRRILTKENQVIGVELADGRKLRSDYVVSCCDGYSTLFRMLPGKYLSQRWIRTYRRTPVFLSYMQISFGLDRDLSGEKQFILYKLRQPLKTGAGETTQLRIRHYHFNRGFAPEGMSSLVVTFKEGYDFWARLRREDQSCYQREKIRVKDEVLKLLEHRFPGITNQVLVWDVATPATFCRRTGNRNGSAEGWYTNVKTFGRTFSPTVKGLHNFYMAGHWTDINGGVTFAAKTGRDAAMLVRQAHRQAEKKGRE